MVSQATVRGANFVMRRATVATPEDGTVSAWGYNFYGQLGDGTKSNSTAAPVGVSGLTDVVEVTSGTAVHACARKKDNTVWCWGNNGNGQFGNGTTGESTVPVQALGLPTL